MLWLRNHHAALRFLFTLAKAWILARGRDGGLSQQNLKVKWWFLFCRGSSQDQVNNNWLCFVRANKSYLCYTVSAKSCLIDPFKWAIRGSFCWIRIILQNKLLVDICPLSGPLIALLQTSADVSSGLYQAWQIIMGLNFLNINFSKS